MTRIGRRLWRRAGGWRSPVGSAQQHAVARLADDPALRGALFRLVDVAPACTTPVELADHLQAFLQQTPSAGLPLAIASRAMQWVPARAAAGHLAARGVRQIGKQFIVGESVATSGPVLAALWRKGVGVTVDLLGEATVTAAEADAYANRCRQALDYLSATAASWPVRSWLEHDSTGPLPRANLSVKVSALTPLIRPDAPELTRANAAERLLPLLRQARHLGAHLHVDMESFDSRDIVLDLLGSGEFTTGPSAGVMPQAYLRDSEEVFERIISRVGALDREVPLTVRLVKGAYWDHEMIQSRHGWSPQVWSEKIESDRCYERLTQRLIDAYPLLRPAIASHNLRSLAHAIAHARCRGLEPADLELQVLRGLGDDLQRALSEEGLRCRSYCPVGNLVEGMAYLVRRMLENTSNDSFLADRAAGVHIDELLTRPMKDFINQPTLELRSGGERARLLSALQQLDRTLPIAVPVIVDGNRSHRHSRLSTDPSSAGTVVAQAASAGAADVEEAINAGALGTSAWKAYGAVERAQVLIRAGGELRRRRYELTALAVRECGKPWEDADADVCEAIDFLIYYAQRAVELDRGPDLIQLPGERNVLHYRPRGIAAVIARGTSHRDRHRDDGGGVGHRECCVSQAG